MRNSEKCIVFHVVTHFDLGGAERVALNIASSPNSQFENHLVEVVRGRSSFSERFINEIESKGVNYHRSILFNTKIGIVLFPFWFVFLFLKYRPSIIHSHTEVPDLSVFLFYKLFGCFFRETKYVRTIHNTVLWNKWERIGRFVESFFRHKQSNVSISSAVYESYKRKYGNPGPIIRNGVEEVQQIVFDKIDKTKINILFAGRLEYQKGIDVLIDVVKQCKENKKLVFWIVGSGSLYKKIEDTIIGIGNVYYLDKIYNLPSYMSSFDYLFMPSHFEGLGLLSIEASLAKLPPIINSCSGLDETLPDDWPLKVRNNCVIDYIRIFNNINNIKKDALGIIAYNHVKDMFSLDKMQRDYELFYQMGF